MIDGTILAILIVLVPLAWGRARYWKGWHEGRADLMRDLVAEEIARQEAE